MHKHLKECSAIKEKQNKDDAVEPARKRKHEPPLEAQALQTPPETYEDAVRAPKRRRFVHHGLAGDVDAVEVGGTTFYNTAPPPAYVSPHLTWTRPGLDRQASAATGSGHQASATTASATTASATNSAVAANATASATSTPAPATSAPASATSDCLIC